MDGYCEITRQAFNRIVTPDVKCVKVENLEHASKAYFHADMMTLLKIDNYLSCSSQFYILDINA